MVRPNRCSRKGSSGWRCNNPAVPGKSYCETHIVKIQNYRRQIKLSKTPAEGHVQGHVGRMVKPNRCSRKGSGGWRCNNPAVPEKSYCETHIVKIQNYRRQVKLSKKPAEGHVRRMVRPNRCSRTGSSGWRCNNPAVPEKSYCETHIVKIQNYRRQIKLSKKPAEGEVHRMARPNRCSRKGSSGWRCNNPAVPGKSYCETHIVKIQNYQRQIKLSKKPTEGQGGEHASANDATETDVQCNPPTATQSTLGGEQTTTSASHASEIHVQFNSPTATQSTHGGEYTRARATRASHATHATHMDVQLNLPTATQSTLQSDFATQSSSSYRRSPRGLLVERGGVIARIRSEAVRPEVKIDAHPTQVQNETEGVTQLIKRIKVEKVQQIRKSERNKMNIWRRKCKETNGMTIEID